MKKRDFLRIAIDLDGTILEEKAEPERATARPIAGAIEAVNALYGMGHIVIIHTARTYRELELTLSQLKQYGIKYHHLVLGKPVADIAIDDRAISLTDWPTTWKAVLRTIEEKMNKPVPAKYSPKPKAVTVLVSAAGSTNGVNVIKALRSQHEYLVRIVAIDSNPDTAGLYLADQHELAPKVTEESFGGFISDVCQKHRVNVVIPTHSLELPFYSSHQKLFEGLGAKIMISPLEKLKVCDDKSEVAGFFNTLGVRHPKIYNPASVSKSEFPLFIKSRFGSGSADVQKVGSEDELRFYMDVTPNPIVQEYVEGIEYTVNAISDYDGKVVGLVPLRRLKVRSGLAVVAQVEINPTIMAETRRVIETLGLIGPSNVQIIRRGEELIFIEINPRFASGGMPLAASAGLNIPLLMIKLMLGDPIGELKIEDRKKMIRYYDYIIT